MKKQIYLIVVTILLTIVTIVAAFGLPSCNVTRIITNESQYVQRGDTSVVIHTKTTETYDASKKNAL